ncbi:MAG TPA: Imm7 family immunity protein, partial [Longimicrobium sp.]|nr:Imm7 family immunity protein [Longimicrobium sp.]
LEGAEEVPQGFHFEAGLNGFQSVLLSGLHNHHRPEVVGVFYWLAQESRRSYGLLYTRNDEVEDPADVYRWRVWRLADGEVTYHHEEPFFG